MLLIGGGIVGSRKVWWREVPEGERLSEGSLLFKEGMMRLSPKNEKERGDREVYKKKWKKLKLFLWKVGKQAKENTVRLSCNAKGPLAIVHLSLILESGRLKIRVRFSFVANNVSLS